MKRFVLMGLVALTAAVAISDSAEARLFRRGRNNCGSNCYSGGCGQNACGGGNCQAGQGWQDPNMMQSQTFDPNAPTYAGPNGAMNGPQTFNQQPGRMLQGNTTFYRGQPQQTQPPQPQLAPNARVNGNANIRSQGALNQTAPNLGTQKNAEVDANIDRSND